MDARSWLIAEAAAHAAADRYGKSLALTGQALAETPDDPELLFARGSILFDWGRFREARDAFLQAEAMGLDHVTLQLKLGWSYYYLGDLAHSERSMRSATVTEPGAWTAHFGLAVALHAQKRLDEAIASCECGLKLCPDDCQGFVMVGVCKLEQGDLVAAEAQFRHAIAVDGERAAAWINLGEALIRQDRHPEALDAFEQAQRLELRRDQELDNFVNLGNYFSLEGRTQDALAIYESNLPDRPNLSGHRNYAFALLTAGRLVQGWDQYEFRWLQDPLIAVRPGFRQPIWAGQDLIGKSILLRAEQGFGDIIQFIRYAPLVKALGATVLIQVHPELEQLAGSVPGIDRLLERNKPLPAFDFYIHLLSLPRVFGTDLDSVPATVPYVKAELDRIVRWGGRVTGDGVFKVGLVWSGAPGHVRDRHRSIPLGTLAPVMQVDGVRFYFLQKGPGGAEAEAFSEDPRCVNLGPELDDFCDTAAVISQLDLVICVDTAVAHLAGALGKPVWLMLPQRADWRWLEGRKDSPWYPTMRLFRQNRRGDWSEVVERVKVALEQRLRGGAESIPCVLKSAKSTPQVPRPTPLARLSPGHRPGFSAAAETRVGIVQYFPDESIVGDSISWYGECLQPQLDLLARMIKPGATLMEVGAGVGVHALFLAAAIGPAGHLFLYEPRPLTQRVLRQNLAANCVGNVTLMRRALGRAAGSALVPKVGASAAADSAATFAASTPSETLDELQLEQLHLLKVNGDVHALDVIAGAADTLWRLRPLLSIAARDDAALTELVTRAKDFGYRCWRMETALFNPDNFNRRDNDIFAGGKALALLAIPEEVEVDIALEGCSELS